ncbi:MAG: squalene synthase HpnC [Alphaproteobacteria bacterium]|nr:squalene synthase HpnC [Alphaproteobacteria bacterium]
MRESHEEIATPSGKNAGSENFPVGSFLIRAELRPHVHAFYRFARMGDDIADNPALAPDEKIRRLDLMGRVVTGAEPGGVPVAQAMRESLAATGLAPDHCLELLHAFKMDAIKNRYRDWAELMEYCRYSAATVGRQVLDLHGERRDTWPPSDALCAALQVINHLQDCGADYREMDRVYLPQDDLAATGGRIEDLGGEHLTHGLRGTIDRCLDRTEELMRHARELPHCCRDFRLRCETAAIVALADRLTDMLRRGDPLAERVKLPRLAMLIAAAGGVWRAFTSGGRSRLAA